jgi:hypothetical protein
MGRLSDGASLRGGKLIIVHELKRTSFHPDENEPRRKGRTTEFSHDDAE